MKDKICYLTGFIMSCVHNVYPFFTPHTWILIIFMITDMITGVVNGTVFKNSPKTKNGGLSSTTMVRGIVRKCYILILCVVASQCDVLMNTDYVYNTVVIAFIVSEGLSLLENIAVSGVKIPAKISECLEVLKNDK